MKDHTKNARTWLDDNNVIVYNRIFEYKGFPFIVEKLGTKFYCVNTRTGVKYKAWPVMRMAVWWACINTE